MTISLFFCTFFFTSIFILNIAQTRLDSNQEIADLKEQLSKYTTLTSITPVSDSGPTEQCPATAIRRSISDWTKEPLGYSVEPKQVGAYIFAYGESAYGSGVLTVQVAVKHVGDLNLGGNAAYISLKDFTLIDEDNNTISASNGKNQPYISELRTSICPDGCEIHGYISFNVPDKFGAVYDLKFQPEEKDAKPIIFRITASLPVTG